MMRFVFSPLISIYEAVFFGLPDWLNVGGKVVVFGLLVNLILTPFYLQMEKLSAQIRLKNALMRAEIARMKRHFRGRERYFYIRTVHRQFGHNALTPLLNSGELLVQILMFVSVYRFLSEQQALRGQAFGPIEDLSSPDSLLLGFPLLPVIMTALNLLSVFVYSQKRTLGVVMALGFLVVLYKSPAGLVLYWTVNNWFSLTRNVVIKHASAIVPRALTQRLQAVATQE